MIHKLLIQSRVLAIALLLAVTNVNATDVLIRLVPVNLSKHESGRPMYEVKTLRFYLSEITYLNSADTVWAEPQGYRLMDIGDTSSLKFHSYIPDDISFDRISFRLGVDSVSSSTGAHTGALDPANGMYWAWHTGYINLKIEGTCNLCPNPDKAFALHIGGFQFPMNAERNVELIVSDPIINIQFDLALILESILSKPLCNIMTPGEPSMRIADMAAQSFSVVK